MTPARLIEWRKQRGFSQEEAARFIGAGNARNRWSRCERGEEEIPELWLWAITGRTLAVKPIE
jgi:transcriptional regulator with XRE-family HTH domain